MIDSLWLSPEAIVLKCASMFMIEAVWQVSWLAQYLTPSRWHSPTVAGMLSLFDCLQLRGQLSIYTRFPIKTLPRNEALLPKYLQRNGFFY